MQLPFDGAISAYNENNAPSIIRDTVRRANKNEILDPDYPHPNRLSRKAYEADLLGLQCELVKMQHWIKKTNARIAIVFEGRDAAGKGGTIKRFRENLNPRGARVVALPKPTEAEKTQWYFQRYINHLPSGGEIVFYDRSWYNRGIVEKVFEFCDEEQRECFFEQVKPLETAFFNDGIHLFKIWMNVGRAEQLRRMLSRERDPLKQWKLSWIDVEGLKRWDEYTSAIGETLFRSHNTNAPWTIIRSDDKRRARLNAIRNVLLNLDYENKNIQMIGQIDSTICGGLDIWHA